MPERVIDEFAVVFGRAPAVRAEAPGRVNLIGEHTDYNGGFVLPTAIPQKTRVELAPRDERVVRVLSADLGGAEGARTYRLGEERRTGDWLDYIQGCTAMLQAAGFALRGFDARIASEVPIGSGVSSSAALEVSLLRALRVAFALPLDDVALAVLGQRVENEFVGARVGIMDQMAASLADERTALFIDTRTLAYERIPLPAAAAVAAIESGIPHRHASGAYNTRRAECEEAARLLGVRQLGDVGVDELPRVEALPEPLRRRARHVVTENARVLAAVAALRGADLERLGRLLVEGHASLRDDFEVSLPEIDLMVAIAARTPGVFGARLTGGGFGGAIVMVARADRAADAAAQVVAEYRRDTSVDARVLFPVRG